MDDRLVLDVGIEDGERRRALADLFGVAQSLAPGDVSRLIDFAAALKQRGPEEMVVFTEGPPSGRAADVVLRLDAESSTCWRGRPNIVSFEDSVVVKDRLDEPLFVRRDPRSDDSARVIVLGTGIGKAELIFDYSVTRDDQRSAQQSGLEIRNADRARALREEILRDAVPVAEAARLIGRSEQTAINRARAAEMLAFRDGNRWMFPSWQFDSTQETGVVRGLRETCAALDVPPYSAVTWFRKRSRALDNRRPIDVLRVGEIDHVIAVAKSVGQH